MESVEDYHTQYQTAQALLEWQVELGATEAIGDAPVDRYELPDRVASLKAVAVKPVAEDEDDPVVVAGAAARGAGSLTALRQALEAFDLCELKKGARQLVFCDGVAGARVMIIGEAPGRDEDREGRPFVGRAGQLLDRMLEAIDLSRERSVYITNVMPWRPPQNRDPSKEDVAMMMPFLERHVALAAPDFIVLMGNIACDAVLGRRGITRIRGTWVEALGLPVLPMFHPAYLLRHPGAKRETWADLLSLKARLK
ncbi:MAG: uracil-DNA glycosylase [Rhodobacteraceae bacterium]|nr:uracil-DNA glycosylase [Paracoccaceae bacterium]